MNFESLASGAPFLDGYLYPLLAGGIALVVVLILTPMVRRLAIAKGAMDDPAGEERRIHTEPIPRWGGIAIYGGLLISMLAIIPFAMPETLFPPYLIGILAIGAVLVFLGALDDLHQYSARIQALYILAAGFAIQLFPGETGMVQFRGMNAPFGIVGGGGIEFGWVAIPLTAIYIFVVTKTMDTIDGVDGLASGIAAIAGACLAVIAVVEGQPRVALVAAAVSGACLGFLKFNYNPAKIFMATGGSQMLGFVLAAISIVGAMKTAATMALIIPMLVFGVPLLDAFVVVLRRMASGQPITQADKRHLHHSLLRRGLSQKQTVWVLYSVTLVLCSVLIYMVIQSGS